MGILWIVLAFVWNYTLSLLSPVLVVCSRPAIAILISLLFSWFYRLSKGLSTSYPFLDSSQSICAVDLEYNNWVMCCRHTRRDWKSTRISMFLDCLVPTLFKQLFFCGILWLLLLYIHIIWMDCHSLNGCTFICIRVHLFVYVHAVWQNWNCRLWSEQAKEDYYNGLLNRGTSCCAKSAVKVS